MAQGSQKRITKASISAGWPVIQYANNHFQELGELLSSPPAGITVSLADESDIHKWKVVMEGPVDSPYAVSIDKQSLLLHSIVFSY
jgi:Ubiquitin-conjugating enzyme